MGNRAGRKRKAGKREANGQLSRRKADKQVRQSIEQADIMHVARSARARVNGIGEADNATDLAGSALGRMRLNGWLTIRQFDAAKVVHERYIAYAAAIGSHSPNPSAVDLNRVHGTGNGADRAAAEKAAVDRWDEIVRAMDDKGALGKLYALVFDLVITDREPRANVSPLLYRVAFDAVADCCGLHMDRPREAA